MRISTIPADAGYENFLKVQGKDFKVTFNGAEIPIANIITVDAEEGSIHYHPQFADGTVNEQAALEYGDVVIDLSRVDMPDAAAEIAAHVALVQFKIGEITGDLHARAMVHDESKYSPTEIVPLQMIAELVAKEGRPPYGTEEYKRRVQILSPMLEHHYEHNDHHPEHNMDGINGMNLMSLVEMFADWSASNEQRDGGEPMNLSFSIEKHNIPPMLAAVLRNTADVLGWKHK